MEDHIADLRKIATSLISNNKADIKEASSKGLISLLRCRNANKDLAHQTEAMRDDTAKGRQALERSALQLSNLLYESEYYAKEIKACRSFVSSFPDDQIAMQPESEFRASADETTKAKAATSVHELMLQRLAHEIKLRKAMATDLESLKAEKNHLLHSVANQEKVVKALSTNLKMLDETAKPLQAVLSGGPSIRSLSRGAADHLPIALYVLYSQLAAAKDALGLPINVAISGSVEEAEALSDAAAAETTREAPVGDEPSESSKKRKSSSEEIYRAHPLSVELEVFRGDPSARAPLVTVTFNYLTTLKLVTALCGSAESPAEEDDMLLAALFPLDDGLLTPSETLLQLEGGTFIFDASRRAKPYRWCQHLAGIDLIPSLPVFPSQLQENQQSALTEGLAAYRQQQRVSTVVSRLQAVKEATSALNALLPGIPKNKPPSDLTHYTRMPQSQVVSWESGMGGSSRATGGEAVSERKKKKTDAASVLKSMKTNLVVLSEELKGGPEDGEAKREVEVNREHEKTAEDSGGEGLIALVALASKEDQMLAAGLDEGEIPGSPGDGEIDWDETLNHDEETTPETRPSSLSTEHDALEGHQQALVKPLFRLFKCVLRYHLIEVETHVRVFLDYPLRPPLFTVLAVREILAAPKPGAISKGGKILEAVNGVVHMEHQANVVGVAATPGSCLNETLLHQLLHLRLAVDDVVSQHLAESPENAVQPWGDLASQLHSRQQLRGRDRRAPAACFESNLP